MKDEDRKNRNKATAARPSASAMLEAPPQLHSGRNRNPSLPWIPQLVHRPALASERCGRLGRPAAPVQRITAGYITTHRSRTVVRKVPALSLFVDVFWDSQLRPRVRSLMERSCRSAQCVGKTVPSCCMTDMIGTLISPKDSWLRRDGSMFSLAYELCTLSTQ